MTGTLAFDHAEIEGSIIARWQRVIDHFPQEIAVTTSSGEQYTYAEIDQASNCLAHALLAEFGEVNCPIILLLDHSYRLFVSILGIIKANKAYVALDPTQVIGHLQLFSQTATAPVIVTNSAYKHIAQAIAMSGEQIWLIESLPTTEGKSPDVVTWPDAIASIVFTSGTTKQPKGAPYTHRMILHRAWFETCTNHFGPSHCISGISQCGVASGGHF